MELLRTQYSQKFRRQTVKFLKMRRKGGCYGSTSMESFWGIIKTDGCMFFDWKQHDLSKIIYKKKECLPH